MATEDSRISEYRQLRLNIVEKAKEIEEAIQPILAFADLHQRIGWRNILIRGPSTVYGDPNLRPNFDATAWPDISNVAQMISDWHGINDELNSAWGNIQDKSGLMPPDGQHGR